MRRRTNRWANPYPVPKRTRQTRAQRKESQRIWHLAMYRRHRQQHLCGFCNAPAVHQVWTWDGTVVAEKWLAHCWVHYQRLGRHRVVTSLNGR